MSKTYVGIELLLQHTNLVILLELKFEPISSVENEYFTQRNWTFHTREPISIDYTVIGKLCNILPKFKNQLMSINDVDKEIKNESTKCWFIRLKDWSVEIYIGNKNDETWEVHKNHMHAMLPISKSHELHLFAFIHSLSYHINHHSYKYCS